MAFFGLFKRTKHRSFDYIPRYYDQDKEDLEQRLSKYDPDKKDNTELVKSRIRSGFRSRQRIESKYRKTAVRRSNTILIATIFILLLLTYIFITKYLPKILEAFDGTQ